VGHAGWCQHAGGWQTAWLGHKSLTSTQVYARADNRAARKAGGTTIAEHESTCVVYGMPRAAIELGVVDQVVPLPRIAAAIVAAASAKPSV
jgi:hypothetical protein